MKLWISIVLLVFSCSGVSFAHNNLLQNDTVFNSVDENGLKQGFWKKSYPNGNIRYSGQFVNNVPQGEFRRYYEEKGLQSIMRYSDDGKSSRIEFYYRNGEQAATGKYLGTKKDSIWKYYSYYGGFLSKEENYVNGIKVGTSREYYENGIASQEIYWNGGIKDGPWKMWFSDEKPQLDANYVKGKLHGDFTTFYPDGTTEIHGIYQDNIRYGSWEYTDNKTKEVKIIKYVNGLPENQSEIDKQFQDTMEKYERNKGKIKEPDLNEFNIKR